MRWLNNRGTKCNRRSVFLRGPEEVTFSRAVPPQYLSQIKGSFVFGRN